jgi:hypothetical protein
MSVETYMTSVDEIFQYLIQPLNNDASKLSSTWEEKVELVPKEWISELEQAFTRYGFKFSYSLKEPETVWHYDSKVPYCTTSAPLYLFNVQR